VLRFSPSSHERMLFNVMTDDDVKTDCDTKCKVVWYDCVTHNFFRMKPYPPWMYPNTHVSRSDIHYVTDMCMYT
jgi:hypothetical protein